MASQSSTSEPNEPHAEHVPQTERERYGSRAMEVLATSNSSDSCLFDYAKSRSTFTVPKQVFTIQNLDFQYLYETKILGAIVKILRSSLPNACQWALNVLRLGFHMNQMANPIVVHLLVARDYLSDDSARSIVKEIGRTIYAAQWEGEPVYVDVCQRIPSLPELRSADKAHGIDLLQSFSRLYSYTPPLPGFSIGPKDGPSCAGSFSGFLRHTSEINGTTEIFGLTCEHVLNSSQHQVLGSSEEYKYRGGKKFMVTMPAMGDHEITMKELSERRQEYKEAAETALKQKNEMENQLQCPDSSTRRHSLGYEEAVLFGKHWEEAEQQAKAYNIEVGHVYATSGRDKSGQFYDGCLDWGIFTSHFLNAKNKHVKYSPFDQLSRFHLDQAAKKFVTSCLGENFIKKSTAYLDYGPDFKSVRETNPDPEEIFFKVASRSLGWRGAQYNGIRATLSNGNGGETREWCFVTHSSSERVSDRGDSGSPLIDCNYQPTAILWGGERPDQGGFEDVTYATPIHEILKDIERRMGWRKGSVTFC